MCDFTRAVHHKRLTVIDDFVLTADKICEQDRQTLLRRARFARGLARSQMFGVIRRAVDHRQHLRARRFGVRRCARQPHVFANEYANFQPADFNDCRAASVFEVAFVIKNRIVRQLHLAINRFDLAATQDSGGVVEARFVAPREANDGCHLGRKFFGKCLDLRFASGDERWLQEQILWLVRTDG